MTRTLAAASIATRRAQSATPGLRIFHVFAPAPFGGLESVVYALATGQQKLGCDVRVIALLETGAVEPAVLQSLRSAGVRTIPVVYPARAFRAQRRSLQQICTRNAPDVVHTHGYLPDVLVASLKSKTPGAAVSTVHGFTGGGWRNRLYERMQRTSYRRFDAVVAVSRKLAGELKVSGAGNDRVHAIPNAWSPPSFVPAPLPSKNELSLLPGAFNIGWVGRITREKGLDVLLDSLPALGGLCYRLSVIGDGRERVAMERKASERGVADHISWCGAIKGVAAKLPGLDVFVISSRTEGTPMTLFEAMFAGVPIVATAVGGIPDVVSSEEALLVPPNDPIALAYAIRSVYSNPAAAARRASRARARLETEFAESGWIDSYDRVYRAVIAARSVE